MEKVFDFLEVTGEKLFFILGIATLPIWFPIMLLWVIIDPSYRVKIWQSRKERIPSIESGKKNASSCCLEEPPKLKAITPLTGSCKVTTSHKLGK
jgi:hypothetical protein